jgi:hypothetical protein
MPFIVSAKTKPRPFQLPGNGPLLVQTPSSGQPGIQEEVVYRARRPQPGGRQRKRAEPAFGAAMSLEMPCRAATLRARRDRTLLSAPPVSALPGAVCSARCGPEGQAGETTVSASTIGERLTESMRRRSPPITFGVAVSTCSGPALTA